MKKWIGLLMAVVLCFSCVSVLADDTPQYTPTLTNAVFADKSCSDILSTSYNRAMLSVLLYLDLSTQDALNDDDFAITISNSYVGKPKEESVRNVAVEIIMYNDSNIYLMTYVPLLKTCYFAKIDRGGVASSLIDLTIDQFIDERKSNSIDDILAVMKIIQEAFDK